MLILGRHLKNQQTSFLHFLLPVSCYSSSRFPSGTNFSSSSPSDLVAKLLDGEGVPNVTIPHKIQAPRTSIKRIHESKQHVRTSIDINHFLEVFDRKDRNAVERAIQQMRDPRFCMNIPAKSFLDGSVLRLLHVLLNEQRFPAEFSREGARGARSPPRDELKLLNFNRGARGARASWRLGADLDSPRKALHFRWKKTRPATGTQTRASHLPSLNRPLPSCTAPPRGRLASP